MMRAHARCLSRSRERLRYLKDLARIEDSLRIERALERAHQRDLLGRARIGEIVALLQADAVFGRDRAAAAAQRAIDDLFDRGTRGRDADAGDQVQIAVAQMAE